jgi:hypothetical protein
MTPRDAREDGGDRRAGKHHPPPLIWNMGNDGGLRDAAQTA